MDAQVNNKLGPKFYPPVLPAEQKLIDIVRASLLQDKSQDTQKQAKSLGLVTALYVLARKMIILKDRKVLTREEDEIFDRALFILELEGDSNKALRLAAPVLQKYWAPNTRNGQPTDRHISKSYRQTLKRYENTLFAIREACSNNDELEVPLYLTRDERDEQSAMIINCIESLWDLVDDILRQPRRRTHI